MCRQLKRWRITELEDLIDESMWSMKMTIRKASSISNNLSFVLEIYLSFDLVSDRVTLS